MPVPVSVCAFFVPCLSGRARPVRVHVVHIYGCGSCERTGRARLEFHAKYSRLRACDHCDSEWLYLSGRGRGISVVVFLLVYPTHVCSLCCMFVRIAHICVCEPVGFIWWPAHVRPDTTVMCAAAKFMNISCAKKTRSHRKIFIRFNVVHAQTHTHAEHETDE